MGWSIQNPMALARHIRAYMIAAKRERYTDDRTWASSGPEYSSSAAQQQNGWDDAVEEICKFIEREEKPI